VRALVSTIRAVPAFFIALLLVPFVGLGAAPGILGLGLHTITTLTKIFAEAIETVNPEPLEALEAVGASGIKSFRWAVIPQVFPLMASYSLYTFESIVRDSTVLAFVGGGGLGFFIYDAVQVLDYADVAVYIAMLIVAVILMERLSDYLRSKII
jgi:phosphonate transport system permease protein